MEDGPLGGQAQTGFQPVEQPRRLFALTGEDTRLPGDTN